MDQGLTRRRFVSGLGAAVLVAGFDPLARRWVGLAEAAACPSFAGVPALAGELVFDDASLQRDATDNGNIRHGRPCAVLRPGSVADVQAMIRWCRGHGIAVAARGQGHTTHGQTLAAGGLVIENRSLATIHSIGPGGADVDAGVLWRELIEAAYARGLTPPAITGYTKLSVGGTLSVGGVGGQTTNRGGLQMDRVQELEVVTGAGERVVCSPTRQRRLFEAVLGGVGQFGVITRARIDLVPAPRRARVHNVNYATTETARFFADLRTLLYRGELGAVYNIWFPFGTNLLYQLQAVAFYDDVPPDSARLMRGLSVPAVAATAKDSSFLDYIFAVDDVFDAYVAAGYERLVKPWYDVWLPEHSVQRIVGAVAPALSPRDVGPTGFVLIFPQLRGSITRPFFRVPDVPASEFVYLFDVLTSSALPGDDQAFATEMLARNRRWYDDARAAGATRYLIGSLEFDREDWIAHYGPAWREFAQRKRQFDPDGILGPGLGIF